MTLEKQPIKKITSQEAKMLKYWGRKVYTKVSFEVIDGIPHCYIQDYAFTAYEMALRMLKEIKRTFDCGENAVELEAACEDMERDREKLRFARRIEKRRGGSNAK